MNSNNNHYNFNGHQNGQNGQHGGEEDEIDLQVLFYMFWRHKWIIAGSALLLCILAGVYATLKTPIYQSKGSLLIAESQNSYSYAGNDLSSLLTSSYGIGVGSSIQNELGILRSRHLSKEIADSLMEIRLMQNGRQFPVLFSEYPDDSTMSARDTVALRVQHNLSFTQTDKNASIIDIAYQSPSPLEAADIVNITMAVYQQFSTHQKRNSANAAVHFLENEQGHIQDELQAAQQNLKQFMDTTRIVSIDTQTEELIKRQAALETSKEQARTKLVAANSAIKQYKKQLNGIKPGLAAKYASAIGPALVRMQYRLAELKTKKLKLIANNPKLKDMQHPPKEFQTINRKIKEYSSKIKEQTQKVINQGDQYIGFLSGSGNDIASVIAGINKELIEMTVEKQQQQAQIKAINKQIDAQNAFINHLPENMIQLARLKRNVEINEAMYKTVAQQYAKMSLWKQTQFGKGKPIDSGYIPGHPIKPNKKLYLLIGFILGSMLGVGYVLVSEAFNTAIDGVEKLKSFGMPLLAVIPDMKEFVRKEKKEQERTEVRGYNVSTKLATLLDTVSPVAEAFRRLEGNIIHSNPDTDLNSLMITSTTQGEGKTVVTANLGVVMAEAGKDIIIVDADLHRPALHKMFGLGRTPGVMEVLFEGERLENAVHQTAVPNVSVLPAGKLPPNPSAIIKSSAFGELIKALKKQYDYVLFDTAPYGIISNTSSFMNQVDGLVVVSRFNKTQQAVLKHMLQQLKQLETNVFGTVLNGFKAKESSDYYYYGYNYYDSYYYGNYTEYE
jgi:capsular exopolysaccharide synthesis family protein